jgi:hypothetical protein
MNCERMKNLLADYLAGELDEKTLAESQAHLAGCAPCREELESLSAIWTKLGVLPKEQPSAALRSRFYDMLEAYKENLGQSGTAVKPLHFISSWLSRLMPRRPAYQLVLASMLIIAGLGSGYLLNIGPRSSARTEVAGLKQQVDEMRRTVAVSLLKQASPSERLMGVSWSAQLDRPGDEIIAALLETMDYDSNVNVRLAAVDALYLFYDHPEVKDGLVHSLARQTSPLVQLSLIDLLVGIRERRAAEALGQLIQDHKINPKVKKRAELGLAQLS